MWRSSELPTRKARDSINSIMGHSCGALEEQDVQSNGWQKSFSFQRGIWTLGTWAKDHLCYILEKNLDVSHKYLEHQREEALKDNGLICLTKILKQRSTQAMAWLLLIALFQIHSGSKPTKQFGEERRGSLSCTRQGGNSLLKCFTVKKKSLAELKRTFQLYTG